jgi:hypothetical protein
MLTLAIRHRAQETFGNIANGYHTLLITWHVESANCMQCRSLFETAGRILKNRGNIYHFF